jgi:PAS domain S-box-containing protein
MKIESPENYLSRIEELENRLAEAEQLIEAIKAGEVDAFALNRGNKQEIFTLQSGDYAYRVLVENFGGGAVNLSEEGLIVYSNTAFHEMLNLSYEKVIGTSIFPFIHPSSQDTFRKFFKTGLAGQCKGEINLLSANKMIPVYVSLTSLYPSLPTVGMIITDLSEKKKQEEKLIRQNEELEKANNELQAFAYISSHDMQEPLRKIQAFSSWIVEKEAGNLTERGRDLFRRMQATAKRMQSLINDLLSYSKMKEGIGIFEMTNLNEMVEQVKEEMKEELVQKNAMIHMEDLGSIPIIPFQFRQLLRNLVSNSLKFSKPDQPPIIKIKSHIAKGNRFNGKKLVHDADYCHIRISDNGIGFDQQFSEKIFDVFQRLHNKDEYTGTGIGLSIVKKIAENHYGAIYASSTLNEGAEFHIILPVKQKE